MVEENLRIHTFTEIPSPEIFSSQIEPKNVPTVFKECIMNWKAFSKWNPSHGGLIYVQERVGSVAVEAMLSRSSPVFYCDIRSHERVPLSFSTFIRYCLCLLENRDGKQDDFFESQKHSLAVSDTEQIDLLFGEAPQQFYLAQPLPLETKIVASVNLWMNSMKARSSTQYDPHHNLLCIVSGCKEVTLWPPSATPYLYTRPLYGEASNHSSVTLEEPDLSVYPRSACLNGFLQKVVLHAGDALFIPEGWFQFVVCTYLFCQLRTGYINSTIWLSPESTGVVILLECFPTEALLADAFDVNLTMNLLFIKDVFVYTIAGDGSNIYCGKLSNVTICFELVEWFELVKNGWGAAGGGGGVHLMLPGLGQNKMLHFPSSGMDKTMTCTTSHANNAYRDHGHQGINRNCGNKSSNDELRYSSAGENDETNKRKEDSSSINDDPVANLILTLHPLTIRNVFLAMADNFPRTLEALVLHALTPVGSEILTRKFEEMDQLISEDQYIFYGVFDDQSAAMDALLNGKELFSHQCVMSIPIVKAGFTLIEFSSLVTVA
ncbi:hypothetical protein RND71_024465 [Anisodus tanguticus]|uniref:JmjC domain-containing protein n=1 Tax=Anisodus tanguticus TaxID=243964 RepID=A0AAE1VBP5_9SOLA|nr:hypothetical protein RND71_024465 [Anisodus tanguticus]